MAFNATRARGGVGARMNVLYRAPLHFPSTRMPVLPFQNTTLRLDGAEELSRVQDLLMMGYGSTARPVVLALAPGHLPPALPATDTGAPCIGVLAQLALAPHKNKLRVRAMSRATILETDSSLRWALVSDMHDDEVLDGERLHALKKNMKHLSASLPLPECARGIEKVGFTLASEVGEHARGTGLAPAQKLALMLTRDGVLRLEYLEVVLARATANR